MRFNFALYQWIFKRLPKLFSIPLVLLLGLYFVFVFPLLAVTVVPEVERSIAQQVPRLSIPRPAFLHIPSDYSVLGGIVSALLILAIAGFGILLSYAIAALLYAIIRGQPMKRLKLYAPSSLPSPPRNHSDTSDPLGQYERIGIILAGGGAKGAYQAGAMQAIYEFLEKHQALHKVRMIAGTSIGSWNSLFWLAGLVKRPNGDQKGVLEQWWSEVDVKSVIRFEKYIPLRQNYLLSPQPWEETFTRIFKNDPKISNRLMHHITHEAPGGNHHECKDAMHFYFTRANVALGQLEFTTNRSDLGKVHPNLPAGSRPAPTAAPDTGKVAESVDDLHSAVFASMDIPPLFKYALIDKELYEDGGVIDNLPIKFGTEFEDCDLLFILPLNASFAQKPNQHSIFRRLFRVMDVRQGILERNAFKMIYLYNELAALRDAVAEHELKATAMPDKSGEASTAQRALNRTHQQVQAFSICPEPELLINTAEFWKTAEAGEAFELMYKATSKELYEFFYNNPAPDWIRMARVNSQGDVTYLTDF